MEDRRRGPFWSFSWRSRDANQSGTFLPSRDNVTCVFTPLLRKSYRESLVSSRLLRLRRIYRYPRRKSARVKMSFAEIADSGGRMAPWQGNAHLKFEIITKRRNEVMRRKLRTMFGQVGEFMPLRRLSRGFLIFPSITDDVSSTHARFVKTKDARILHIESLISNRRLSLSAIKVISREIHLRSRERTEMYRICIIDSDRFVPQRRVRWPITVICHRESLEREIAAIDHRSRRKRSMPKAFAARRSRSFPEQTNNVRLVGPSLSPLPLPSWHDRGHAGELLVHSDGSGKKSTTTS